MPRITNSDQVILLLQNQLQRLNRGNSKKVRRTNSDKQKVEKTPLNRVQSIAQREELEDDVIKRTLIGGILTEEFGAKVANDPSFQKMIDSVYAAIENDEQARTLLNGSVSQIKRAASE